MAHFNIGIFVASAELMQPLNPAEANNSSISDGSMVHAGIATCFSYKTALLYLIKT